MLYYRYETFNSVMRAQNIFGNKHAPSRDIANNLAVLEYIRFICSGGIYNDLYGTRLVYEELIMQTLTFGSLNIS